MVGTIQALTASEEDRAVLARSLNDRNDQLEALQRRINETEHEKKQLQDRVRHSEREMASLRDEITRQSCDTTRHTDQDIFIRDERIAALERELEDQRRRASGMETEARQLSALRDQLDAARSLNEERQQEKDQVINTLHAEIERLQQLNEGHAVMSAQIVRLQHDLSTRGQELSELRAELEQGMREKKHLVALEQQRSHRITELQARLAAIKKEQEEVISDYNARLQHEIAVREDSERNLSEQLEEAKRAVLQVRVPRR
jgi:chromosome segregation ATPase